MTANCEFVSITFFFNCDSRRIRFCFFDENFVHVFLWIVKRLLTKTIFEIVDFFSSVFETFFCLFLIICICFWISFFVFSLFLFSAKRLRFLCELTRFSVFLICFWFELTCFFVSLNMILKVFFFVCFFYFCWSCFVVFFFFKMRFCFLIDFNDVDFILNRFFVMTRIARSKKIAIVLTIFSFFFSFYHWIDIWNRVFVIRDFLWRFSERLRFFEIIN